MGHVQQLGHRGGQWQARIRGADGRERTKLFRRKIDADRWVATQEADQARGQWVDPALGKMTFGAFVDIWEAGLHGLRDSSLDRNLGVVRNHLLPRFGKAQLARITHADVKAMVADDMIESTPGQAFAGTCSCCAASSRRPGSTGGSAATSPMG